MSVTFDNKQITVGSVSASTLSSASFTVTGTNTVGVCFISTRLTAGSSDPTSVTWNGSAMTKALSVGGVTARVATMWYIYSPSTGVITANWSGAQDSQIISALSYTGSKQSSQPDSTGSHSTSNEGAGTTDIPCNITTASNNTMVISGLFMWSNERTGMSATGYTARLSDTSIATHYDYVSDKLIASAGLETTAWAGRLGFEGDSIISIGISSSATLSPSISVMGAMIY